MKDLILILAAATLLCIATGASAGAGGAKSDPGLRQIRERFANPTAEYRALPMCSFDYSRISEQVKEIRDSGWGGANLQFPDWGAGYLESPDAWSKFTTAIDALKANGLLAWIYDERGYPSGKAGSLALKDHPEYEAQGLFYVSSDFTILSEKEINWRIPDGKPYYIALFELSGDMVKGRPVDLTDAAQDGMLRAMLKPGNWRVMAFVRNPLYKGTHADFLGERYVNLMDPRSTDRFLQVTHEAYFSHCGDEFGKTIKAFFTDEPSLMGGFLKDEIQEYPALSWYDGLPAAFQTARGYDIREALPSLFNNSGPNTARKRCDVYRTIADLTAENLFARIQRWCKAHKVASAGHLLWEESLIYHANFYGDILTSLAEMDIPGIDVLGCNYGCTSGSRTEGGPVTPKLISSSAHVHGKERTCSESFCFVTKATPLADMIAHVAWQWVLGINTLNTLSMQQEHPADVQRKLNEYTGRLSYMLTRGKFAADVAVLYPIASVWADFSPTNRGVWNLEDNPRARKVDDSWQAVSRELLASQRDFDYVDESNIQAAKVSDGVMKINKRRYSILVLPNTTTLRMSTLRKISQFVEAGGTIISCGDIPSIREDAGSSSEFRELVSSIWDGSPKQDRVFRLASPDSLYATLAKLGNADVKVSPKNADIYYQRRSLPSMDIYFIVNNSTKASSGDFTFRAVGKAETWNPMTGETRAVNSKANGNHSTVTIDVPARNGVFVVFAR